MPSTNRSGARSGPASLASATASEAPFPAPEIVADIRRRPAVASEPGTFAAAAAISDASGPGTARPAGSVRSRLAW
jgi:hypothetical protein